MDKEFTFAKTCILGIITWLVIVVNLIIFYIVYTMNYVKEEYMATLILPIIAIIILGFISALGYLLIYIIWKEL